ncbi:hypothetical protein K501DRAFT_336429 [Backusella circina FSU 941]|nr:hypothetical protein K501DRAFT_336429 [Backusella circina FSU 941]
MFLLVKLQSGPNVVVGSLIMYILLLLLCIFAFVKRSSIDRNTSLHQTMVVAVFGLLNCILLLAAFSSDYFYSFSTLLSGLYFGVALTPLIWMVGITIFLTVAAKRPVLVMVGYFFTFVQLVLMITLIAFLSKILDPSSGFGYGNNETVYTSLFFSMISINWVFFLLFCALAIQHRHSVSGKIMATLIVFGVLNTVRLIVETVFTIEGGDLGISTYYYIMFFFTDFISAISLYMSTIFWKGLKHVESSYDS